MAELVLPDWRAHGRHPLSTERVRQGLDFGYLSAIALVGRNTRRVFGRKLIDPSASRLDDRLSTCLRPAITAIHQVLESVLHLGFVIQNECSGSEPRVSRELVPCLWRN